MNTGLKWVNLMKASSKDPRRHTTSYDFVRLIDVETMWCVYRGSLQLVDQIYSGKRHCHV